MYRILFVCTGNICRSPTAEAVFRHHAEKKGFLDIVEADSAGTHAYHVGEPPNERSAHFARLRGYSMEGILARKVEKEDFDSFNLILGMDKVHLKLLNKTKPKVHKAVIELFMNYASGYEGMDVPDPYYGGTRDYLRALDLVEIGMEGVFKHVEQVLGSEISIRTP